MLCPQPAGHRAPCPRSGRLCCSGPLCPPWVCAFLLSDPEGGGRRNHPRTVRVSFFFSLPFCQAPALVCSKAPLSGTGTFRVLLCLSKPIPSHLQSVPCPHWLNPRLRAHCVCWDCARPCFPVRRVAWISVLRAQRERRAPEDGTARLCPCFSPGVRAAQRGFGCRVRCPALIFSLAPELPPSLLCDSQINFF